MSLSFRSIVPFLSVMLVSTLAIAGDVMIATKDNTAILDNGIIRATIDTSAARDVSLKYKGLEMMNTRDGVYFSFAGGASYERPYHCDFCITKQTPEMVDISCKRVYSQQRGDKHAWDIDIHYVLHKGMSGLYSYAILEHKPEYPDAGFGEWRTIYKTSGLFDRIYVDELRQWEMPSAADWAKAERTGIPEAVKMTTGPRAGKYECKYTYAAKYWTTRAFGHVSNLNNVGAWFVLGGCDYFNDGPMKSDLTAAAGIIHLHLNMNHFGAGHVRVRQGESWSKIYGPWLIYFNDKKTADECWADAKKQAELETAKWPYQWLDHELYQAKERVTVKGRFIAKDPLKPDLSTDGAWVGLALPENEAGQWQYQASSYQYWAQADKDGSFTIKGVRPGTYTLYAFTKGAVGEYSRDGVVVRAGSAIELGDVVWNIKRPGKKILWEIGVPDRLPAEFRHGSTDWFEPFMYEQFVKEFSNPLEYNVAEKNSATALNYVQNVYDGKPWKWRLNFELDKAPDKDATLTLAFAASDKSTVKVYVNDESKELEIVRPPNGGGNGLVRQVRHTKYGLSYVTIPADRLKAGKNTITLENSSSPNRSHYISYDYISLEI